MSVRRLTRIDASLVIADYVDSSGPLPYGTGVRSKNKNTHSIGYNMLLVIPFSLCLRQTRPFEKEQKNVPRWISCTIIEPSGGLCPTAKVSVRGRMSNNALMGELLLIPLLYK